MRYLFIISIVCVFLGAVASHAQAAVLVVDSEFTTFAVGDVFAVEVSVDTEHQSLNTAAIEIEYPHESIELVDIQDGESVLSFWIQRPESPQKGKVTLTGMTPGGFVAEKAPLITLRFRAIAVGQGAVSISQSDLRIHDGLGTAALTKQQNLHVTVLGGSSQIVMELVDDEAPEEFVPFVLQDEDIADGAQVLVFATKDKGSGIDYFAVKEGVFGSYVRTESPYILRHQSLDKKITVKAVDKLGNERVAVLYPQDWQPWYERSRLIVGILLVCALFFYMVWRYFRHWSVR